ncbi:MAG: hypothetical protein KAI61_01545 [Alphaproteobacteria bacterium]|nr:hypothetical protein [Alphaproteobacteria bacterium]
MEKTLKQKEASVHSGIHLPGKVGVHGSFGEKIKPEASELQPFMPTELIGGSIPYIPGKEDEGVWNAAAQSCGTERVHYCYVIDDGRVWYLAAPSSSLASNPDSWCPLAAALPGNSEYWDRQTVYLYEQEGMAGALRWDQETGRLQLFLGVSRTILPRIQSMEANFVTINPEVAKSVPWKNRALRQEQLSRMLIRVLFLSGIGVTIFSLLFWVVAYTLANAITPKLDKARAVTTAATNELMVNAANALQTNTDRHLTRIIELLNMTSTFGGILTRYEVKENDVVEWTALIPSAVQPGQIQAIAVGMEDGRVKVKGTH